MNKRYIFLICILWSAIICHSQSISVSSFKLLDSDLTANTAGTMEQDQNGEVAALIKVVTTQTGFAFDGGAMGIVKTKQTPGEIWVYVPRGSKKITIKHPQLGVLRDYFYPISIESARTYEMILLAGTVQTIVQQTSNSQYLVIKVTPADAVVELNNELLPTSDGIAEKFVKLGSYEYRVQAPNYHTTAGMVEVTDPNNKKELEINLNPAFGWIEIPDNPELEGAQVFIDNALSGTIPMKSQNIPSGKHSVKIVKPLYHPFSQDVIVKDNEVTQVTPVLSANFSEVTVTVENDNEAEIYINNEYKGNGVWAGKLEIGSYLVEAKKEKHRTTSQMIEIVSDDKNRQVSIMAPTPIYGEINITSTPTMSEVFIDGERKGKTPLYLPKILIGKHHLQIKHDGYNHFIEYITISENNKTTINAVMDNTSMIYINLQCNVPDAEVYVDNHYYGKLSNLKSLSKGEHALRVVAPGYNEFKTTINLGESNKFVKYFTQTITLTKQK